MAVTKATQKARNAEILRRAEAEALRHKSEKAQIAVAISLKKKIPSKNKQ